MFLWTEFTDVPDTKRLLAAAVERGVAFVPGNAFTIDQAPDSKARFSYSTLTPDLLREAVRRLSLALDDIS
jgi:2-aminoadipate transaminase